MPSFKESGNLIKQGKALFLELFEMRVVHRLDVCFTAVDFPVQGVVLVAKPGKVCIVPCSSRMRAT